MTSGVVWLPFLAMLLFVIGVASRPSWAIMTPGPITFAVLSASASSSMTSLPNVDLPTFLTGCASTALATLLPVPAPHPVIRPLPLTNWLCYSFLFGWAIRRGTGICFCTASVLAFFIRGSGLLLHVCMLRMCIVTLTTIHILSYLH